MAARRNGRNGQKKQDQRVQAILDTLRREYLPSHPEAQIDAYRYNPASIRLRIIDPGFARKAMMDRDDPIWELLARHLPAETVAEIGLVVLLTPSDDRFGRALDAFFMQRHSVLASLALHVAREFNLSLNEVHYDPTHILLHGA